MMNHEAELKLQAYLDGELPAPESQQAAEWLSRDEEAQALGEELRATKTLLSGNELEVAIPESREFYWSKIERAIAQSDNPRRSPALLSLHRWWLRFVPPLAAGALLVAVLVSVLKPGSDYDVRADYFHEIETSEGVNAISFHSPRMTVVWIQSYDN